MHGGDGAGLQSPYAPAVDSVAVTNTALSSTACRVRVRVHIFLFIEFPHNMQTR